MKVRSKNHRALLRTTSLVIGFGILISNGMAIIAAPSEARPQQPDKSKVKDKTPSDTTKTPAPKPLATPTGGTTPTPAQTGIFCPKTGGQPPCPQTQQPPLPVPTPVDARAVIEPPVEINRPRPTPVDLRAAPMLAEIEATSCGYDLTAKPVRTVWRCELNQQQVASCKNGGGEIGVIDMQVYCRMPPMRANERRRMPDGLAPTPTYPDPPAQARWQPIRPSGPGGPGSSEPTRPTLPRDNPRPVPGQ